jgi:hypothetical protein
VNRVSGVYIFLFEVEPLEPAKYQIIKAWHEKNSLALKITTEFFVVVAQRVAMKATR